MANSPIITTNLEREFRASRERPRTNVLMDPRNMPEGIPSHLAKQMARRAQVGGGVDRVGQFRHNPFLQATNLDIPSDLKIRHQYMRHFVKTNALVGASIELHSEYPLSGFHIEHEDPAIQEFFENMIEETDLVDHVFMCALEWWTVGEFFSFGFFDDVNAPSTWAGFMVLDPDKLLVQTSPWCRGPRKEKISLVVDNLTQKIVEQGPNHPVTGPIYRELPPDIIMACRARRPLELSPLQVSHMKRGSPFASRGESVLERVFSLLMYKDKLRSAQYCSSFDTRCLTKEGWVDYTKINANTEVGTYNRYTGKLEYQKPSEVVIQDYKGPMVHFKGQGPDGLDIFVTPNHRMWAQIEGEWQFVEAINAIAGINFLQIKPEIAIDKAEEGTLLGTTHILATKQLHFTERSMDWAYDNKVWCVTVPNGLLITERNGKVTIQGNTIADRHLSPCHDEVTECLTREGWKHYTELKITDEIATYNVPKGHLEYQKPEELYVFEHKGSLVHFKNDKRLDIMVTGHHRMLCREYEYSHFTLAKNPERKKYKRDFHYQHGEWKVVEAKDVRPRSMFRCALDKPFTGAGKRPQSVNLCGKPVGLETYLAFAGYFASEGYVNIRENCPGKPYLLYMPQMNTSKCFKHFCETVESLPGEWKLEDRENGCRVYRSSNQELASHFLEQYNTGSGSKKVPQWVKDLPSADLELFLATLVLGDGHRKLTSEWKGTVYQQDSVYYTSTSKQLANDVQDIAFRCGYAPMMMPMHSRCRKAHHALSYDVFWSVGNDYGKTVCVGSRVATCKTEVPHDGHVWCVKVPNKFFVTRRNGKIAIHHNTEIWKIGEPGDPADNEELEAFREMIASQYNDTNRCFHPSHECLTKDGWKHHTELTLQDEVGTFNRATGALEYQKPSHIHEYDFDGELVHFTKGYNDILVTPNHRMLVDEKKIVGGFTQKLSSGKKTRQMVRAFTGDWQIVEARDIKPMSRFRAVVDNWEGAQPVGDVKVTSLAKIPLDLYLRFAGWFVAEGSAGQDAKGAYFVALAQKQAGQHFGDLAQVVRELSNWFTFSESLGEDGCIRWICSGIQEFSDHCTAEFGKYSANKRIPGWILQLSREHLATFLERLVNGDGHRKVLDNGERLQAVQYCCTSKKLVDQIQEIALKLGKNARITLNKEATGAPSKSGKRQNGVHAALWLVYWNENTRTGKGDYPYVGDYHTWKEDKQNVQYKGKVWCVTVPNETVITRRAGRVSIQLNSVIWHHALQYQIEGANGKLMPIWQEMDSCDNEILAGLLINKSLIMGDSSTFASDVVRYDILINRYLIFRKKIEKWLLRSVFAPLLKIHEMYVPEFKVKSMQYRQMSNKGRPLSFPTIKWEKQNLKDDAARTSLLIDLASKGLVPYSAVYPLLSLEPRQVNDKIDQEIEERLVRRQKLAERLAKRGLSLPQDPDAIENQGAPGGLPMSLSSDGGGGGMGLPSAPGGMTGDVSADSSMPGGSSGGLPTIIPGTEESASGGMTDLPGQPSASSIKMGVPTA